MFDWYFEEKNFLKIKRYCLLEVFVYLIFDKKRKKLYYIYFLIWFIFIV